MADYPEYVRLAGNVYFRSLDYNGLPTWESFNQETRSTSFMLFLDGKWRIITSAGLDGGKYLRNNNFSNYINLSTFDNIGYTVEDTYDSSNNNCFCDSVSSITITNNSIFNGLYERINSNTRSMFGRFYSTFVRNNNSNYYIELDVIKRFVQDADNPEILLYKKNYTWNIYGVPIPFKGAVNFSSSFDYDMGVELRNTTSVCPASSTAFNDYFTDNVLKLGNPPKLTFNAQAGFRF